MGHISILLKTLPLHAQISKLKHLVLTIFLTFIAFGSLHAQIDLQGEYVNAKLITAHYTLQFPFGDAKDRFGFNNRIGAEFNYKFKKNLLFGFNLSFMFGGKVKEDSILNPILNSSQQLTGVSTGNPEIYGLFERGFSSFIQFGKVFSLAPNKNSGIMFLGGIGYIQHKIFIQVSEDEIPQLDKDYKTGYDRLSGGPALSQFLGYLFLDNNKYVNFYAGVEFIQGFTKLRRNWVFDAMNADASGRVDLFLGVKLAWIIPAYTAPQGTFYFD